MSDRLVVITFAMRVAARQNWNNRVFETCLSNGGGLPKNPQAMVLTGRAGKRGKHTPTGGFPGVNKTGQRVTYIYQAV